MEPKQGLTKTSKINVPKQTKDQFSLSSLAISFTSFRSPGLEVLRLKLSLRFLHWNHEKKSTQLDESLGNHSIFMTNDSMFLISCWLCWATSDFLSPFGDFDAFQKPLSVVLFKGIHKKDPLKIWSWWLRVWVPQHISMRFRLQNRCLADLKLLFARHLFKGSRVLVSTMYDHLPRDKYIIMLT